LVHGNGRLRALAEQLDHELRGGQPAERERQDQGREAAGRRQGRGARGQGQAGLVRGGRLPAAALPARDAQHVDAAGGRGAQEGLRDGKPVLSAFPLQGQGEKVALVWLSAPCWGGGGGCHTL